MAVGAPRLDLDRRACCAWSVAILAHATSYRLCRSAAVSVTASVSCCACSPVFSLNGHVLRLLSDNANDRLHGVRHGAVLHRRRLPSKLLRDCRTMDESAALLRHITHASVRDFVQDLSAALEVHLVEHHDIGTEFGSPSGSPNHPADPQHFLIRNDSGVVSPVVSAPRVYAFRDEPPGYGDVYFIDGCRDKDTGNYDARTRATTERTWATRTRARTTTASSRGTARTISRSATSGAQAVANTSLTAGTSSGRRVGTRMSACLQRQQTARGGLSDHAGRAVAGG